MMNWYLVLLFSFLGSTIKSASRKRNVVKCRIYAPHLDKEKINDVPILQVIISWKSPLDDYIVTTIDRKKIQ
jgi:hypothetical protein